MFDVTPATSRRPFDCGPTCLMMLLAYYGEDVDLETLIKECGESVWGCTGADLMRAGRLHGLDMTAWKIDADELVRQDRPTIVWWRRDHWCVLCGIDDDGKVVVCNPDKGRYRMTYESFEALYAGIALASGEPMDLLPAAPDNIPAGAVFEVGGAYYRALAAIARGEAVTSLNATPTSVADEINAITTESEA